MTADKQVIDRGRGVLNNENVQNLVKVAGPDVYDLVRLEGKTVSEVPIVGKACRIIFQYNETYQTFYMMKKQTQYCVISYFFAPQNEH